MMGEVIEFGRRNKAKLPKGFWQQEYLLFPSVYNTTIVDLPSDYKIPAGVDLTVHPGNAARFLVNDQLLRILALSPRDLREAVFVTPLNILRFRYSYNSDNNFLTFTSFLKTVSSYVKKLETVVLDNLGMHCWFPEQWVEEIDGGQFNLGNHLAVHTVRERESDCNWIHTHGMTQFACPDLEVRMVSEAGKCPTLRLLSQLMHYLFKNGPVFREGCRVAIAKGHCWATFKYYQDSQCEGHYHNNYFRILISVK